MSIITMQQCQVALCKKCASIFFDGDHVWPLFDYLRTKSGGKVMVGSVVLQRVKEQITKLMNSDIEIDVRTGLYSKYKFIEQLPEVIETARDRYLVGVFILKMTNWSKIVAALLAPSHVDQLRHGSVQFARRLFQKEDDILFSIQDGLFVCISKKITDYAVQAITDKFIDIQEDEIAKIRFPELNRNVRTQWIMVPHVYPKDARKVEVFNEKVMLSLNAHES